MVLGPIKPYCACAVKSHQPRQWQGLRKPVFVVAASHFLFVVGYTFKLPASKRKTPSCVGTSLFNIWKKYWKNDLFVGALTQKSTVLWLLWQMLDTRDRSIVCCRDRDSVADTGEAGQEQLDDRQHVCDQHGGVCHVRIACSFLPPVGDNVYHVHSDYTHAQKASACRFAHDWARVKQQLHLSQREAWIYEANRLARRQRRSDGDRTLNPQNRIFRVNEPFRGAKFGGHRWWSFNDGQHTLSPPYKKPLSKTCVAI